MESRKTTQKKRIGERIKERRKEKGLTQKQLAKELQLSQKQISKYENNESQPPIDQLQKLTEILEVSADWLLTDTIEFTETITRIEAIDPNSLGGRIRKARQEKNLIQRELSEKIDIKLSKLNQIERNIGRKPEIELIEKIAQVLDTSTDWLLYGDKNECIANKPPEKEFSKQQQEMTEIMEAMTDQEQTELLGAVKMYIRTK